MYPELKLITSPINDVCHEASGVGASDYKGVQTDRAGTFNQFHIYLLYHNHVS
jgi:hypothetical protein